jgi:hypothetical protein
MLVEEIGDVTAHRQAQQARQRAQQAVRRGRHLVEPEHADVLLVELPDELAQRDRLANASGTSDQREALQIGPQGERVDEIALGTTVEHLVSGHVLAERHAREGEVRLEAPLLGERHGRRVHGASCVLSVSR